VRRLLAIAAVIALVLPGRADASVADELAAAQRRANRAAARLSAAEADLARAADRLTTIQTEADAARRRLERIEGGVRASAIRQYMAGGLHVPFLLGSDLRASVRANELARYVTVGAASDLDRYRIARDDLEEGEAAVRRQVETRRDAMAALRKQRAAAVAEVSRLARVQRQLEAKLAAERARSRSGAGRSTRVVVTAGDWACPVACPHSFTHYFGDPRSGGRRHQGNDILAPYGTPVVASVAGSVQHHNSSLGGLSYYLRGSDGNTYYGAHLSRYAAAGSVGKGTVIGYVGTSGNASGGPPHLHFEIHPGGGAAVNPYPTLSRYC
jgi:murein DD-endopeptidase MepM/ murein hydrolase activator NlpD